MKGGMHMRSLIPWKKKKEQAITEFRKDMDSLFDKFFGRDFFPAAENLFDGKWLPSVDVSEGKKDITVKAEIPGVEAGDIDVSLNGRVLTVRGEKKQEKEEKDKSWHEVERSYGYFSRSVELPADVESESVNAAYKRGVLKITLKKTREAESRKVKIKTS
jgi:HSP20 family protein